MFPKIIPPKINDFLLSTFSATCTFFTVPKFVQASLPRVIKISAKVGDNIELDCSSDGHPHPEALWYKYNIPLLDITYRKIEGSLKFRKLVLNNLLLADAGNYSCWVNGTLGSSSRTFILHVFGEYGTFSVIQYFIVNYPVKSRGISSDADEAVGLVG